MYSYSTVMIVVCVCVCVCVAGRLRLDMPPTAAPPHLKPHWYGLPLKLLEFPKSPEFHLCLFCLLVGVTTLLAQGSCTRLVATSQNLELLFQLGSLLSLLGHQLSVCLELLLKRIQPILCGRHRGSG